MNGCFPPHERENVALNAATGGAGPRPVITTLFSDPITVVSVTLDADRLRNPSILLTFTGIVNLPLGISVTLNFELLRSRGGGAPSPPDRWRRRPSRAHDRSTRRRSPSIRA